MLLTKIFFPLLAGGALSHGSPIETDPLLQERKAEVGCPNGAYLLFSAGETVVCAGPAGLAIVAAFSIPVGSVIGGYSATLWRSSSPPPVSASIPAGNVSSGSRRAIGKRDAVVQAYNVEMYAGYDYHNSTNPQTDDDWVSTIQDTMEYMDQQQIECLQAFVDDAETNYENRVTIWIDTGDGVNHRSC